MIKDKTYTHAHKPLAEQNEAVGHAVRSVYLMTGLAHIARMTNDEEKRQTCLRIWNNMVQRRMYITGGIGSQGSAKLLPATTICPTIPPTAKAALQLA